MIYFTHKDWSYAVAVQAADEYQAFRLVRGVLPPYSDGVKWSKKCEKEVISIDDYKRKQWQ